MDGIFAFKECVLRLFCQDSKKLKKKRNYKCRLLHTGATQWRYYAMQLPLCFNEQCN